MPPYDPFAYGMFPQGMQPFVPRGLEQMPPNLRPGFPPAMPAGTTSAPPFGGMDPRIGTDPSMGGVVDSITDQILERLFAERPGQMPPSNMPQGQPPFGSDPRMGPPPSFNRQGMPLRPGTQMPMNMPPGRPQMPPPSNMPQTQPPWGGPNASMSAAPQFNRQGMPMRPNPYPGPVTAPQTAIPQPLPSNMPQTQPPWGGPDARMAAAPQFDRQGNPIFPGPQTPMQRPVPPEMPPYTPAGPPRLPVDVPPGGFGGADPRIGPMPQPERPSLGGGPMPNVPPGGFGGPNASMSAAPTFNRQGIPQRPPMPEPPGPPGPSIQQRMIEQYGTNPLTGGRMDGFTPPAPDAVTSPSRAALLGGGPGGPLRITEPNAVVGANFNPIGAAQGGPPRIPGAPGTATAGARGGPRRGGPLLGMNIDPSIGESADFISAAEADARRRAITDEGDGLPKGLRGEQDLPTADEIERSDASPVAKETLLGAVMRGFAAGLPGAIVAFAADRAHSPELAEQYSKMKARELSELQQLRQDKIRMMENKAEQARHEASLGMQKLTLRMDIEKNLQQLQQTLGTTDPAAYSRAVNSLLPVYATTGADPQALRENHPFLAMEVLNKWREQVKGMYKDVKDEDLDKATIVNPFTQQIVSLRSAMAATYGIDDNGYAISPSADLAVRDITTRNAAGIEEESTVTNRSLIGAPGRIKHPTPNWQFMFSDTDPITGMKQVMRGNASSGAIGNAGFIPGQRTGLAATLDEINSMDQQSQLRTHIKDFLKSTDRYRYTEPPETAINAAGQNPEIMSRVRQKMIDAGAGRPNMPRR